MVHALPYRLRENFRAQPSALISPQPSAFRASPDGFPEATPSHRPPSWTLPRGRRGKRREEGEEEEEGEEWEEWEREEEEEDDDD